MCKLDYVLCSEFYVRWSHGSGVVPYRAVVIMSKILHTKGICGVIIVEENDDEVLLEKKEGP